MNSLTSEIYLFSVNKISMLFSGLPDSLLQKAAAKSREFEATYGKHRKAPGKNLSFQCSDDKVVEFIKNLNNIAAKLSCRESPESKSISCLIELQHRARMLMQKS